MSLELQDLEVMEQIIRICQGRGVFKPEEMIHVGVLYKKLVDILEKSKKKGDSNSMVYGQSPMGQSPFGQSPMGQSPNLGVLASTVSGMLPTGLVGPMGGNGPMAGNGPMTGIGPMGGNWEK